ncbi:DUF975 family protein [Lacticaseibacillus porcinae]|uniref:DUF975 family protein n=1 Tax=Lacticaseibacillus porcinae TaxID=1123687 RepID=UPI000F7B3604|nr:DUF975 family protein [Lacticaseibacillus porcinae]
MDRAALKQQAKLSLQGRWGWAVGFNLLGLILASIVGGITFGILEMMVTAGIEFTFLAVIDDREDGSNIFNDIFSGFTSGQAMAVFLNTLLSGIFIWLWSLLLVVPGLIKSLAYSQANYILKDMQDAGTTIGAVDAITASRQLMDGHKWEYFVLQLSFLGWAIVATLTAGIGYLWLLPYIQATNAAYYRQLAGDQFRTAA